MTYKPNWDLSTIPLEKLKSEWARRSALKRIYGRKCECGACQTCINREAMRRYRAREA